MKVTADNLKLVGTEFTGYLEGDKVDQFFSTYGINFSAGHWCAGGFSDRFCTTYSETPSDDSPAGQIRRVAKAKIAGIELNNEMFLDAQDKISQTKITEI